VLVEIVGLSWAAAAYDGLIVVNVRDPVVTGLDVVQTATAVAIRITALTMFTILSIAKFLIEVAETLVARLGWPATEVVIKRWQENDFSP
jgi:hypothetical protein